MPLLAIPNVSEGRNEARIALMLRTLQAAGAALLDVHSDVVHHRSVFTLTASDAELVTALTKLAETSLEIPLDRHEGVHPRLGALDVCPIVPHEVGMESAVTVAHATGESIHRVTNLPIYFYGEAAVRDETRELPDIRRGGLEGLMARAASAMPPDLGGNIDPAKGVVCVGARGPLIAFNVNLAADLSAARSIASSLRGSSGGLPGVRALGFPVRQGISQISMNLTQPQRAGIDEVFDAIAAAAAERGLQIEGCEVVGLVANRFLPDPGKQAARLLKQPDLCLESKLFSP
jgi:glutamate formiminotransferase